MLTCCTVNIIRCCHSFFLVWRSFGDGHGWGLFFRLPPDHCTLGLITKTSIPVWSWSHSVRTLMKNMWSCPDTVRGNPIPLHPPFPSPFPLFIHSFFLTLYIFCCLVSSCHNVALLLGFLSDIFQTSQHSRLFLKLTFSLPYQKIVTHCNIHPMVHPCSSFL